MLSTKRTVLPFALAFCFFQTGCQTLPYQGQARDIKLKPKKGGVIGLPLNPRTEDRQLAQDKMTTHCAPGIYEVLEEGEVAVGQKTKTNATNKAASENQVGSLFGLPVVSTSPGGSQASQVTTAIKEWHITYKCGKAQAQNSKR